MATKQLSTIELSQQLKEQIGFIRSSCKLYDKGSPSEAKRIATAIRILVYDKGRSRSLLKQLTYKTSLKFLSLSVANKVQNSGPYHGLLNIVLPNLQYVPKFNGVVARPMSFDEWWIEAVLKDADGTLYNRKDLILAVANRDGGAHVDPEIEEAYEKLTRKNHIGYEVARGGRPIQWIQNPVLPSLRQIGHEMLETLKMVPEGQ